ncbi:hypothetical protein F5J12DRAFT_800153 [Pisolithus orientalis]|uniref:uncharacterized protein n=1 Tax=Pisolithus orientalis TaxID=936130 RepID=UPI0022254729|nr:uncharacterized protein F5J12DRAFT_800153 [Pisolithus orientalis]KAI6030410.1 hypothetical protein F5J12DRAFT_800153 [Pisolithus orientalis]
MVRTRRKSKAVAAAAAAAAMAAGSEDHFDGASTQGTEEMSVSAGGRLAIPIPVDVDVEALSNLIPEVSFTNPTPDTIVSIYRLLLAQVAETDATHRDVEELRAEVERKDIELDQAVQDGESKSKDLESSLESAQTQLNALKTERDELANSRDTSSTELDHLRHRVEECEKEKRELIGVVSRLKEDASQRDEEIQTLRTNLRQARQEQQALESQVRELRSADTANKFKIETLSQQLGLAQDETARVTTELTSKSEEYARYRRTKHAEFIQLQTAHDALIQKHASVESSFKAIQSAHEAQTQQLTQALSRVQDFQGKLAEQEAAFSTEVSGLKRLVTIMEEREKQAKDIVESIEHEWAGVGDRAEKREAALRAETEKERRAREEVEKRLEQLEIVLERINRGELPVAGRGATSVPGTPGRWQDGAADPMFGLSPTVAMVSRAQKGGKTFTEVYADYVRLEEEYARKCTEYDHMDRTLSEVLAQIEERAPILAQQREEYERLQLEATQLSAQLSAAISDRDANAASIQELSQKIKKAHNENDLLQHQLTDLGRQIQTLLKELGRHEDPSVPSDEILDQMEPIPANDIEAVITNNLVLFRSIPELQEQNQRLLKVVREMGAKMEAEERDYRATLEQEQSEAVREAHEAIQELVTQLERQKKSSEMTIQAYMKERDTLKAMLAQLERGVPHVGLNGDIGVNGASTASRSNAQPSGDLAMELADAQAQFESYRQEMGVDSSKLREDFVSAQRELGRANADLAKANAKIQYLDERHRMSQEQLALQSRDLDQLSMRNQQLYDQQMRLDIDKERVMDELATVKSDLEQLRNEAANLRAEKRIWESVQTRLIEDNKSLSVERAQLADLVANVQRIHGDLERSGENDRKRLETQIQMMESQTQELKVQLSQERETLRHVTLQRDIDMKDLQARLDKTAGQLAQARESLVGAETSKTHLQDRVEQLTRQLQGNEEKLAVYERRVSGASAVTTVPASDLPREQQLEQEVAELRSALKVAQVDLASARTHMQQFQEISQANEAALTALNATHDQYKTDAEARAARLESECRSLQEKLRSVEDDLQQAKAKVTEIQHTLENERTAWANDKRILEGTIVDLSTSERVSENDRTTHEQEIRELEQRAIAAEERYAREVVTHAESLKNVENLRHQLTAAQATARQNLAEAASAQAKLEASEGSWKQQKEALEKEIADLNARYDDLSAQKALLYQHLDTVSSQAARIRQVADSSTENTSNEADTNDDSDVKLTELRAVIGYLRKEKEIVDLQLELCKQENVRLKGQTDHLSRSLQEARSTLSEERERTIQAATSDAQHAEMLERINQLNILRESNATLRADCENYTKRARELGAKLKALSVELEPAKEEARIAQRNAQLLSKYDRIDPAEVQSLKDEIDALKAQKAEVEKLVTERDAKFSEANSRVEALEDALRKHKEAATKNMEGFRQRLGHVNQERSRMNQQVKELQEQVRTLTAERDTLHVGAGASTDSDASKELTAQLDALRHEKAALEKALAEERAKPPSLPTPTPDQACTCSEKDRLLAEKEALLNAEGADALKAQWAGEKAELSKARDEAVARAKEKFQVRIQDLQRARDRANTELAAAVEKAKSEMSAASAGNVEELVKRHAKELEDLRALLNAQHEANLDAAVHAATLAAKAEATVASNDDATKAAIDAAIAAREQEFQTRLNDEIEKAVERGRMEQSAKSKLKDSQLVRSQLKVKELEAQILEWKKAGIVPDSTSAPATTTMPATTTTPAAPTSTVPSEATPASATESSSVPSTSVSAGPVRRQATSGAVMLVPPEAATRGRGRGASIRGGQRGISIKGRGGAPSPTATTAPSQQQGAIQIMGAAAKRAREDDVSSDDSLAKRIKPAEASTSTPGLAVGTSTTNKPPVTIRRPQPPA